MVTKRRIRLSNVQRLALTLLVKQTCLGELKDEKALTVRFVKLILRNKKKLGWTQFNSDQCVFKKKDYLLLLYVDDILIMGQNEEVINKLKQELL